MRKIAAKEVHLLGEALIRCVDGGLGKRELKLVIFLALRQFTGVSLITPGAMGKLAKAIGDSKANTRQVLEALAARRLCKIDKTDEGWVIAITDWRHIVNALDGKPIEDQTTSVVVPGGGVATGTIEAAPKAKSIADEKAPLPTATPFAHLSWAIKKKREEQGDLFYSCYDGRNLRHCKDILRKAAGEMPEAQRRLDNLVAWATREGETFFTLTPACLLSQWDRLFNPPPEQIKKAAPSDPYAEL